MLCRAIAAVLLLSGFYAGAQFYGAKRAQAQEGERRVVDYLQAGWEIKAAIEGPPRVLVLQKGGNAIWCQMRDYATPVTLKGVPQLLTASCSVIR
jgi:hypothetical protein